MYFGVRIVGRDIAVDICFESTGVLISILALENVNKQLACADPCIQNVLNPALRNPDSALVMWLVSEP